MIQSIEYLLKAHTCCLNYISTKLIVNMFSYDILLT